MQAERRDHAEVLAGLRGRDRRGALDVLDAELVEQLRDGDLVRRREVRVRELLPLTERGIDDRESLDRHAVPPSSGIEKARRRAVGTSLRRPIRGPPPATVQARIAPSVAPARPLPTP